VNDPGSSMFVYGGQFYNGAEIQGVTIPPATLDLLAHTSFAIEGWFRVESVDDGLSNNKFLFRVQEAGTNNVHLTVQFTADADGTNRRLQFTIISAAFSAYVVVTPVESVTVGQVHHVVAAVEADEQMVLYLDGVRYTTLGAGVGTDLSGVVRSTGGTLTIGYDGTSSASPVNNWQGEIDDVSVLLDAAPAQADVTRHYEAGTHPWQDDLPGTRIGRILDLVGWPADRRQLDTGLTVLQSATLDMPALEHLQTVAETEFGLLFVDRTGNVRFDDRTAVFAREPGPAVYGDEPGEVGYRAITPDDGDEVIRNRALISRLNGAVRRADDEASIEEFGRFDYHLEGLYHRAETYSQDYADLIVAEYHEPRRRITALEVGPPIDGEEDIVYPAMLGPELGDAIVVSHNPTGGGDPFTQTCAVEGIAHAGAPGGVRTVRFALSPELAVRALEDEEVATLGYAQVTANQGSITTLVDLSGLTATVTVGANRYVKITGVVLAGSTVAADTIDLIIREGGTELQIAEFRNGSTGSSEALMAQIVLDSPSAGSHTYKLSMRRAAGTGTITMTAVTAAPAFILVEDIGSS
jgi:hypothetical protein